MADAITEPQDLLAVIDHSAGSSSSTPNQSTPQNPRRVANVVRQRRRKNLPSLRHAKDSTEQLRRTMGGHNGNTSEPGQVVATEGEYGGRDRSAIQYTVGNIASGRIYLRYAFGNQVVSFGDMLGLDDHTQVHTDNGTFRIVIERPSMNRPKTADTNAFPQLDVQIPHYKLGTPRFSVRGTATLRSSAFTRNSDADAFRSSFMSARDNDMLFPGVAHISVTSGQNSVVSPRPLFVRRSTVRNSASTVQVSSPRKGHPPITPDIYEALTANPDDPAFVRFNATSRQITAATPARLVAHITSPSFLDYELLSDFFLTFRSYLSPSELVSYLVARLEWAVNRLDNFGRIVRVRTFVALRHWILNYFVDDFVPDRQLRIMVCQLVNKLYSDVKLREGPGGGDLKIIGELKKCWRRTCALYWEMPDVLGRQSLDDQILPGGEIGSRLSTYSQQSLMPAVNIRNPELQKVLRGPADDFHDLLASKSAEALQTFDQAGIENTGPVSMTTRPESYEPEIPNSPFSERSLQVVSCSIPMRTMPRNGQPNSPEVPLFPHPVHITPATTITGTAPAPQPSAAAQPNKANTGHKRSGSFNDALRDERAGLSRQKKPEPRDLEFEADMMAAYPFTAGLIRGIVMQPVSPYVDDTVPLSPSVERLELFDFESGDVVGILSQSGRVTLAANPGVRKLLGSVRRALSTRHGQSPTRSDKSLKSNATSSEGQLVPSNALTAPLSERRPKKKTQMRIDLLSAGVCESFRRAMIEEFDADGQIDEAENQQRTPTPSSVGPPRLPELSDLAKPNIQRLDSNVTVGSRSIVIVDDTQPPPIPEKSMARQSTRVANEARARQSAFIRPRENITSMDTAAPDDEFGTTLEDMRVMDDTQRSPPLSTGRAPDSGPTSATVPVLMPLDQPSPVRAAPQPLSPISPLVDGRPGSIRRHSSFDQIFKASESVSDIDESVHTKSPTASPRPAHQLRRKPGGDLKAARNVHDLGPIKRPRSAGSITNVSYSVTNSIVYSPSGHESLNLIPSRNSETLLSDRVYERERAKSADTIRTTSSQPNTRASFSKEVARLAELPDDDDDGDINVALAKLEGKYEKRSPEPQEVIERSSRTPKASPRNPPSPVQIPANNNANEHNGAANGNLASPLSPKTDTQGASIYHLSHTTNNTYRDIQRPGTAGKVSVADTEDSYSSIPLLERGLSVHDKQNRFIPGAPPSLAQMNALTVPSSPTMPTSPASAQEDTPNSSIEHVEETESMRRIPRGQTMPLPRSSSPRASFLLDSDEELSDFSDDDLSTEIGDDFEDRGIHSFYHHETSDGDGRKDDMSHPLHFPPTPPPTGGFQMDNGASPSGHSRQMQIRPPSPDPTPVSRYNPTSPVEETVTHHKDLLNLLGVPPQPSDDVEENPKKQHSNGSQRTLTPQASQPHLPMPFSSSTQAAHVPFILSYGSNVLAQQFTIIERDALDELDWKELVNLNFSSSDSPSVSLNETPRDWVNYLRTQDPRGLALITARFNIVVKWAVSEILLIPDDQPLASSSSSQPPSSSHQNSSNNNNAAAAGPSASFSSTSAFASATNPPTQPHNHALRVATIRKYIHVALACRRLRNFATMAQLVIALTSGDIARLARTWEGVPKEELAALAELERLVGPVGNFGRLRREMEGPTLALAAGGGNLGGGGNGSGGGSGSGRTLAEEEQGTIPFVGVYTHDLIYNAQKPPYLPSSTRIDGTSGNAAHGREGCSGEGLVNFERHHRAAGIVKNLLRLLESSGRYVVEMDREPAGTTATPDRKGTLRVVPEALARCLWLGALTDREIAQLSRRIEP
ncbi:MAG: hypothetical protein Q9165_008631 [Trypethelium subeluteriae]